jgi:uncharacterized membrane protein YcaP (DUF421 family)
MDWPELGLTALRATVMYVFLLIILRILGKRTVGNFSAFDFMVALILGEVVDEPIYGDVPMVQGLLVIAVVAVWHYVNEWLSYRSERFDRLSGGGPTVLVRNGLLDRRAMAREHVNVQELWSMLRLHSVDRLQDVKTATLEPDGELSVILTDEAEPLRKGDLADALRRVA